MEVFSLGNKGENKKGNLVHVLAAFVLLLSVPISTVSANTDESYNVYSTKEMVIITFKDGVSESVKKQIKQKGKAKKDFKHINASSIEIDSNQVEQLKDDPNVKSVEPDIKLHIPQQEVGYGQEKVKAQKSWESGLTGKGIKVGDY